MKIIAEIAQAHDGSLGIAHSYIDAVAKAGADIIKFQTHFAEEETTIHEPWRIKFSMQDENRYEYWKRMQFSREQWFGIKNHCDKVGLKFMSSPFSIYAVNLLKELDVFAWKIASGEINNYEMIDSIAETNKEIFISTGMSTIDEIDKSIRKIKEKNVPFTILQCTSMYPTPPEKIGLNILNFFKERYGCNVGLSDHSGEIFTGLAAASLGSDVLEVHVTFNKDMFGPDVSSSITIDQLKNLVDGSRFIERIIANKVNKDFVSNELKDMRAIFNKSIVYKEDLNEGVYITKQNLVFKKPGTGLSQEKKDEVLGRRLTKSVKKDDILQMSDFE